MLSEPAHRPIVMSALRWRAIAAWLALAALLLLSVLNAIHLASGHDDVTVARAADAGSLTSAAHAPAAPRSHGDDDRCGVCFTFHATCAADVLFALTFAFLFFALPARPIACRDVAAPDRRAISLIAIPRGPPAFALA